MKPITRLLTVTFLLFTMVYALPTISHASIPKLINYQGRLCDSTGKPISGAVKVVFRLYDQETAGSPLWTETYNQLNFDKGIFSVLLGGVTPLNLDFEKQYWLSIQVGTDPEMTPRQRLTSAAYAFRAEHGVPKGVIVMWSGTISNIPTGWALCNGNNGTPDLRDKFIVGAREDDNGMAKTAITDSLTKSGGSTVISINNLPAHTHPAGGLSADAAGLHTHTVFGLGAYINPVYFSAGDPRGQYTQDTAPSGTHTHSISGNTGASGAGVAYAQPYYALAFIMKME